MSGAGLGFDYTISRPPPRGRVNQNQRFSVSRLNESSPTDTSYSVREMMTGPQSTNLYGDPSQYQYTPPEYTPFEMPFVNTYQSGDYAAQETMADLYEAEWADYMKRFFPIQQGLIQEMTTGFDDYQQQEVNRAQRAVARAYANTSGTQRRRMQGYGVYTKPAEIQQRETQMSKVGSTVAATNFARQRAQERRMQILSGGLGEISSRALITGQQ